LDVGTGTGIILVSLAKLLKEKNGTGKATGVDVWERVFFRF
jgi:ubiquinone/menaquinone biosynthesis C-methylase UbiE